MLPWGQRLPGGLQSPGLFSPWHRCFPLHGLGIAPALFV
nr:MAG TPA: hypothetical protein [Caudoviricetes sp.]